MVDRGDRAVREELDALAELNFSVGARAYSLALKTLDPWLASASSPDAKSRLGRAYESILQAGDAIASATAEMRLVWNAIPVSRFLRSQAGVLSDSFYCAGPKAVRGYGALAPTADTYLAAWYRSAAAAVEKLDQAIYRQGAGEVTGAVMVLGRQPSLAGELNPHQRTGLGGALSSLAQTLLLIKAYGYAGLPPLCPGFAPSFDEEQLRYILSLEQAVEDHVAQLGDVFGIPVPWKASAWTNVMRTSRDAAESLSLVSAAAWDRADPRQARLAELAVMAGRVQALALNLRL